MTQVAVSIKDVLREMKELKPASSDPLDEASDEVSVSAESGPHDSDNSCEGDLGSDLSPEEMKIAELATTVVSEALVAIKELIRSITGLLKLENPDQNSNWVNSLEGLLKLCQEIGAQIDEVGACLYPPQEVLIIKAASEKIARSIGEMQAELETLKGSSEAFLNACTGLRSSLKKLESKLDSATSDLVAKMENLAVIS